MSLSCSLNVSFASRCSVLRGPLGRTLHPPVRRTGRGGSVRGPLVQGATRHLQGQGQVLPLQQQGRLQRGAAAARGRQLRRDRDVVGVAFGRALFLSPAKTVVTGAVGLCSCRSLV